MIEVGYYSFFAGVWFGVAILVEDIFGRIMSGAIGAALGGIAIAVGSKL